MIEKEVKESKHFGTHLTLDGYMGNPDKLNDFKLVEKFLNELPGEIDMEILTPPQIKVAPPVSEKDAGGISGFVIINESHISIHTFPKRRFVSIDVYSCKSSMDRERVIEYTTEFFDLEDVEINYILRGKKYPDYDLI